MKNTYLFSITLIFLIGFVSCSDEEPELSVEEQLIGNWRGDIIQPGFGTLDIQLNIRDSQSDVLSGTWTTASKDFSNCDQNLFDCVAFSCNGSLKYKGMSGQSLTLDLTLSSGPCFDNSVATIQFIDDNTIRYSNTDADNTSTITGTMSRQ